MRILITGGAGFLGSHLAERLVRDGHDVWILDDLSTGSMRNIDNLTGFPGFHYRVGSVMDQELVGEMVDRVDTVFHLAAAVGVKLIVTHPTSTIETNIRGTEVVLDAAAKKGKLTVIASTSEVYGKSTRIPFQEDDDLVLGPTTKSRWGYACSKAIDEYLALAYAKERDLPVLIARFFNIVGPRQTGRYGMVLPNFVQQGLAGENLTVYGSGEQRRCFADVADVVESLLRLIAVPGAYGRVFNIGSDEEISINELAELVRTMTGMGSSIEHVSYERAYGPGFEDLHRRVPSVERLAQTIGFRPRTPIRAIVGRVIQSMKTKGTRKLVAAQKQAH